MTSTADSTRVLDVVDSHTGGEPTRVVIAGGPPLRPGPLPDQVTQFRTEFDHFRSAVVNEPRGSDVMVGALLVPPVSPQAVTGVIFFNNVGYLGMCGHGTIGLMVTLAHLGRIGPGDHLLDTPVGPVTATLHPDGGVSLTNVPSYRKAAQVSIEVPGLGPIRGDVSWGGNWFFLVESHPWSLDLSQVERLTEITWKIRQAVNEQGFPEVDHVELFSPGRAGGHSRNFVLCPGKAYDRSPCGTGTSAKLACLAASGKLAENEPWIQESILGSSFEGHFRWLDREQGIIAPVIRGTAFVTAECRLRLDPRDPFRWGVRS
ncbi:MAG: proline racemase family protein [Verrucomicrobia bacterium]|nr:proline racemase family protein [Verrucomicrobiota bacterium]